METAARRIAIVLASLAVSVSAVLGRLADMDSMGIVFYRLLLTVVIMSPLILLRYRRELLNAPVRDVMFCTLSGIVLALHFYVFYESLNYTTVASSLVFIDTSVFFIAIIMLFLGERVSKAGWAAIAVTFAGSVIISMSDIAGGMLFGDLLALSGAVLFAIYAVIGRRERASMSAMTYTFIVYTAAAMTALVLSLGMGTDLHPTANDLWCALGMAVFCTLLGHSVFSWGLKYEKASFIAVVNLLEPVFGSAIAFVVLGEVPAATVVAGAAVVLLGVYLFSRVTEPDTVTSSARPPQPGSPR